ncbi:unnamed protein product [Ascophyllum nodosum]
MDLALHIVWKVIPRTLERIAAQNEDGLEVLSRWAFLYTIAASVTLAIGAGAAVKYLGYPGDLPNVVDCVHKLGYVPIKQTVPMIVASLFSIAAGGSVGPEAPLVAVSAAISSWLSMNFFKHDIVMVQKCTIIGMSAGLGALFGVQLGGSLFALEVLSTMGMQFFETAVYSIGAGGVCLAVYRGLQGQTFGEIWSFAPVDLSTASEVVLGTLIGLTAGAVSIFFRAIFRGVAKGVERIGLGDFETTNRPIVLAALGGLSISILGVLVPPTMFWSEFEIGVIAEPGTDLPHVWPPGGLFYGLERYPWETAPMYMLVGFVKLLAIACAVQAGFRGGFIFPLFFAGASIGRGLQMVADSTLPEGLVNASPALMCMCFAAGLNTAVMRTPFASALILAALSGAHSVTTPVVCASLASLFITRFHTFLESQRDRADIKFVGNLPPISRPEKPAEVNDSTTKPKEREASALLASAATNWEYSTIEEG